MTKRYEEWTEEDREEILDMVDMALVEANAGPCTQSVFIFADTDWAAKAAVEALKISLTGLDGHKALVGMAELPNEQGVFLLTTKPRNQRSATAFYLRPEEDAERIIPLLLDWNCGVAA